MAQDDMFSIWLCLLENAGLEVATDFETRFYRAFEQLARLPYSGHTRTDLTARPVRFWGVSPYLIVYRPDAKPLEVLRILHGKRDLRRLLA
jgi:plasmid stabilization system protein ParE